MARKKNRTKENEVSIEELFEFLFSSQQKKKAEDEDYEDFFIEDQYDEYYVTLQGTPFREDAVLRCHYCFAPIEAYGGKLERSYVWFSVHKQTGDLECNGLVCKRCAEKRILPVKPCPTLEEEKKHIDRLMKEVHTSVYIPSKLNT